MAGPVAAIVALPLVWLLAKSLWLSTIGYSLVAVFFGAILVQALAASSDSVFGRVCSSSTLRFFGRYSYGLYVVHHPLLWFRPAFNVRWVPTLWGSQWPPASCLPPIGPRWPS